MSKKVFKTIISLILIIFTAHLGFARDYSISTITYEQGLSENTVSSIVQDSLGYIWVGTREGLNRYDGYSCKRYFAGVKGESGLRSNFIDKVLIDSNSEIWVQTSGGLSTYIPQNDEFKNLNLKVGGDQIGRLNDICISSGIKWLATASKGLVGIDPKTRTHLLQFDDLENIKGFCVKNDTQVWIWNDQSLGLLNTKSRLLYKTFDAPDARRIIKVKYLNGVLCLATNKGIVIFDEKEQTYIPIREVAKAQNHKSSLALKAMESALITDMETIGDDLWIATDGEGIVVINIEDGISATNIKSKQGMNSLSTNSIKCLFKDEHDNVWIGTVHNGLNMASKEGKQFKQLNLVNGNVSNFIENENGSFWVATFEGLCLIDSSMTKIVETVAKGAIINVIVKDDHGNILLGTYNKGLLVYNIQSKRVTPFNLPPYDFSKQSIRALINDRRGNILIGTNGVYVYKQNEDKVHLIDETRNSYVSYLLATKDSSVWVGMGGGIHVLNSDYSRIEKVDNISEVTANCMVEDPKDNVWIGTNGQGLFCVNKGCRKIDFYGSEHGLVSNIIHGVATDLSGNLWLTTNSGIAKFIPPKGKMKLYDYTDGLMNNQFIDEAILLAKNGNILCGGEKGIDYFMPDEIKDNTTIPKVIVDGYFSHNKPVVAGSDQFTQQRRLTERDTLVFKYNQSYFSFHFTGIEYTNAARIQYEYQLSGFDNRWTSVKGSRIVNYGHIPPGSYTFKVKASNSDGYWTPQPTEVKIVVKPPFTKTPLAYLLYFLILSIALYVTYRYLLERKLLQTRLENEAAERKRIIELNQLKMRVFTHVSHEFRTPLSLIIAPVIELQKRLSKKEDKKDLDLIHNNARKLQILVNQVLEVRKIESGAIQMNIAMVDMIPFVRNCFESFQYWANQKNINLTFSSATESQLLAIDQSLMEKVMYNLLSNAMKYTLDKGEVSIRLLTEKETFAIIVCDTGIEIPKNQQGKLFDMFYRVDNQQSKEQEGSGVGLALSKELVEMHKGTISVESGNGDGTCFTVRLPLSTSNNLNNVAELEIETNEIHEGVSQAKERPELLLVDDNEELRNFLSNKLSKNFNISQARNGSEALKQMEANQPQLVVSDVMMPEMDGWELCSQIKSDLTISHIPVILLTALGDNENTLKGLELGADAYVAKPFEVSYIESLVRNLLGNRARLQKNFEKGDIIEEDISSLTRVDREFIETLQQKVIVEINNPDLKVQKLSEDMAMSRVNLHTKLKALCGVSPSEFIMQLKLKEAKRLLASKEYRISEISDMTGFSTPSHLSRNFKKQYGCSPREYINGKAK